MDKVSLYYLSKNGSDRDQRMKKRFKTLDITANQIEWVDNVWLNSKGFYNCGCFWGHIKMIKEFLKTDKEYGIFLEDDVYIHKKLTNDMSYLLNKFNDLNLDILLIGYLINYLPVKVIPVMGTYHSVLDSGPSILSYHNEMWGAQGYILNRKYALKILEMYNDQYLEQGPKKDEKYPFNPDWTITKFGKRALVYPMYMIEEGEVVNTDHQGQITYHKNCFLFNYKENLYV